MTLTLTNKNNDANTKKKNDTNTKKNHVTNTNKNIDVNTKPKNNDTNTKNSDTNTVWGPVGLGLSVTPTGGSSRHVTSQTQTHGKQSRKEEKREVGRP